MKRLLHYILVVAIMFICSSSVAVADCNDTTYDCYKEYFYPSFHTGSVTLGNCTYWHWDGLSCEICGKDYGKVARRCNEEHPKRCQEKCIGCDPSHAKTQCWDVNGHRVR